MGEHSAKNDRRVQVDYCAHTIVPWAVEEMCQGCHQRATHKVEETSGPRTFHPLTAYLCCGCFSLVGDCANYPYDIAATSVFPPAGCDESPHGADDCGHPENHWPIPPGTGGTDE